MSKEISVSDEYIWTTSTGLYQWVLEYLESRIPDRELWDFVEAEGYAAVDNFFVSDLPEPHRHRVLRVLAEGAPEAYATWRFPSPQERAEIRRLISSLEILSMMAAEVLRELNGGEAQ
ncbi:hypothetical protein [Kitasatospora sp. MAP5-34]|uniref:hypothetical protein n=1 Tax=Kitasatospora sp. MAP5-34 TaxID=3035102 RepID=UPI002474C267|nr:hypothetical protein [Kitasatospora sp. MAP5-34]MDH6575703.1 hypothetical protein [Kitasatospora sp. MAP5-34]